MRTLLVIRLALGFSAAPARAQITIQAPFATDYSFVDLAREWASAPYVTP